MDRYESAKPKTTVVNLFHTLEKTNTTGLQVDKETNVYEDYEDEDEYDYNSGDYDLYQPRGKIASFLWGQFVKVSIPSADIHNKYLKKV